MKTGHLRSTLFTVLFAASIAFGLFKQAKTAWRSAAELGAFHAEPGADAAALKERLGPPAVARKPAISYRTDRPAPLGLDGERRYDVQYGFAPYILRPGLAGANCEVLDLEGAALELVCLQAN